MVENLNKYNNHEQQLTLQLGHCILLKYQEYYDRFKDLTSDVFFINSHFLYKFHLHVFL